VLTFLCMIGVFAAIESMGGDESAGQRLFDGAVIALCTAVGIWAVRRYLYFLNHAEACANQADCPNCKTYGKIAIDNIHDDAQRIDVHCKQCEHRWVMYDE
jgi:predicted Zn finger-like uncharacterized protein